MKQLLFICFFQIAFISFSQIKYQGKVISLVEGNPIPYVNIGIINKNVGTVSNDTGFFSLIIPHKYLNDSIRFSSIGYESKVIPIKQISKVGPHIMLNPVVYTLPEAIVKNRKIKTKIKGCKLDYGIPASFGVEQLGNEIGILVNLKNKPTRIKNLNIYIADNICEDDTLFFRVNIYSIKDKMPYKNILTENILIKTVIKKGLLTVDLEKYNLYLAHDFIITIEWLRYFGESCFYLRYRPILSNNIFYGRVTSQGEWSKTTINGFEFYLTVEQ